jgi:hypothetical protein
MNSFPNYRSGGAPNVLFLEYRSKIQNDEVTKVYVLEHSNLASSADSDVGDTADPRENRAVPEGTPNFSRFTQGSTAPTSATTALVGASVTPWANGNSAPAGLDFE